MSHRHWRTDESYARFGDVYDREGMCSLYSYPFHSTQYLFILQLSTGYVYTMIKASLRVGGSSYLVRADTPLPV